MFLPVFRCKAILRVVVGMVTTEQKNYPRKILPIDEHKIVIIATTHTAPTQQQIKLHTGRGRTRAIRENFHVSAWLSLVSMLEMTARHKQQSGSNMFFHPQEVGSASRMEKSITKSYSGSYVAPSFAPPQNSSASNSFAHSDIERTTIETPAPGTRIMQGTLRKWV
jgi:hypothetical protein